MKSKLTRKDRCHLVSKRASQLNDFHASKAWFHLCGCVEGLGQFEHHPLPKFDDLLEGLKRATSFGEKYKL